MAESGITLYDYVTGEPYCARMLAGELVHVKGACATIKNSATIFVVCDRDRHAVCRASRGIDGRVIIDVAARTTVVVPPATDKSDTQ